MKLSFVLPVYNAEQYLQQCVDSICQSSLATDDYELILVDDGSADGSYALAQQICRQLPNARCLTQPNQGSSVARNAGIELATADYLWFIDADDYLLSDQLGEIAKAIDAASSPDIFAIQELVIEGKYRRNHCVQPHVPHNKVMTGRDAVLTGFEPMSACSLICRRDFLKRHNLTFYPGISHQDVEFTMRAVALADSIYFSDFQPYVYVKHFGSVTKAQTTEKLYFYIIGDAYVAKSYKAFARSLNDKALGSHIAKWANGILVNLLNGLRTPKSKLVDRQFKERALAEMKDIGVYPVRGRCFSWKMWCYAQLLNFRSFVINDKGEK